MKKTVITATKIALFFVGWGVLLAGLFVFIPIPAENPAIWRLVAEAGPLLFIIAITFLFWLFEKRRISIISPQNAGKNMLLGCLTGSIWLGLAVMILFLSGTLSFTGRHSVTDLPVWLLACFLNVVMQELLVRGYMYQLMKKDHGTLAAIVVTTVLFTLLHGGAFEAGAVAVLNVVSMSLFMSFVLEYTDSLIPPIIIHAIWNGVGAVILGGVSLADDYPHLLETAFTGNGLLTGGACKLEGSIVTFILNIFFAGLYYVLLKRKRMR